MRLLLRQAIVCFLAFTLLTGVLYPLAVTGLAQVFFPRQANGSLVLRDGRVVGSELIGQEFSSPKYFWSRPSATAPRPYNAEASAGSNLGPLNPKLGDSARTRAKLLLVGAPAPAERVPVDLITSSGSGLDPHISPAAAFYQVARVAGARHMDEGRVRELVLQYREDRQYRLLLGEPRVNVLRLNLALDRANP